MNRIKEIKSNKGFTLVELIVVMAIMGIVTGVIYHLFTTTGQYTRSVELLNEYQNITTEVIYALRVELADRANAESFDIGGTDTSGALKYDESNLGNTYGYIIAEPVEIAADGTVTGGGATIRGIALDGSGNVVRTADEKLGMVSDTKPYRVQVSIKSLDDNRVDLGVTIYRTDYKDPSTGNYVLKDVYSQKTTMILRSTIAGDGQQALRYSIAA